MEHTKKYFLVLQERLSQFVYDQLSESDGLMHDILKKTNLQTAEKVTLYQQALQKCVKFPVPQQSDKYLQNDKEMQSDKNLKEDMKIEFRETSEETIKVESDDVEQEMVKSVPSKFQRTVKEIIDFMRQPKLSVFWTPDKELVLNGKVLKNTNIVALTTHFVRDRKRKPPGFEKFYETLMKNKLPPIYVKNKYLQSKSLFAKPIAWDSYEK